MRQGTPPRAVTARRNSVLGRSRRDGRTSTTSSIPTRVTVIPYELVELLDPVIEDLVISLRVRDRRSQDDGGRRSLAVVAADLGADLNERPQKSAAL